MDIVALLVGLVVGLVVGFLVAWIVRGSRATQNGDASLGVRLAQAEAVGMERQAQIDALAQRNKDLVDQQERDARVVAELTPIKEVLHQMTVKVNAMENEQKQQHGLITQQLTDSRRAGDDLRATTESLASALRSNNVKGQWGEAQLRRIVEVAGLLEFVDFSTQETTSTEGGKIRPDMTIRLPGGRTILVDAKVPFTAYLEASQIPPTATGEQGAHRAKLPKDQAKALRAHIDNLSGKAYWDGFDGASEFVVAFVPSESLLSVALELDPTILEYAFTKRVALASPVNLWAVLKTVAYSWRQQVAAEQVTEIIKLGQELYKRVGVVAGHADSLRAALDKAVKSYNEFAGSLERNMLTTAKKFPGMDPNISLKEVPAIAATTEGFRKEELTSDE
ncbi:MAG: DNA recombination protein RmuC [Aurantimicrobium sp.]|nr:DNA recombination protein RmuC [Aurantimicrobium sp.]